VPTYDYQCRSCGSVTEVIHSMLEEGPSVCERCGGELRRVLYPTGIIFKGSGFYRNDSRSEGTTSSESKPSGDSVAKTDAKPKTSSTEGTKGSGDSGS
jgi:putative FmdB family regulatory protein